MCGVRKEREELPFAWCSCPAALAFSVCLGAVAPLPTRLALGVFRGSQRVSAEFPSQPPSRPPRLGSGNTSPLSPTAPASSSQPTWRLRRIREKQAERRGPRTTRKAALGAEPVLWTQGSYTEKLLDQRKIKGKDLPPEPVEKAFPLS
ncbi:uncharacterized protein PS065_000540 [Dugong dugon]